MKTQKPSRHSSRPPVRRILLEVLFFLMLAALGFSVFGGWKVSQGVTILNLSPLRSTVQQAGETTILHEAPSQRAIPEPTLSPVFTPSVQYWKDELMSWAEEAGLDPNLVATVMQIESCGNPRAGSSVGALGLFQVMPYHFEDGEDPFDPDTNAQHGLDYLVHGLELSGGHPGLALAGYNGGHAVIGRNYDAWAYETQRYYRWGSGIYREASAGWESSPTLAVWLRAGGQSLCSSAEEYLGLGMGGDPVVSLSP